MSLSVGFSEVLPTTIPNDSTENLHSVAKPIVVSDSAHAPLESERTMTQHPGDCMYLLITVHKSLGTWAV